MLTNSIFPDKRPKNPLSYLWTKWNQTAQEEKCPDPHRYHQNIFGAPLENVIQYSEHGVSIPITVQLCFTEIVKRGLKTEGLFRLSGATSEVIQLQQAFEMQQQRGVDLSTFDIHAITSFIKKYLHHLPTAVIPADYHDAFLRLASLSKEQAVPMFADLILLLPDQHRHLFHAILSLASHIQRYAHINMMNPEALSVVLAPVCTGLEKTIQILPKKASKRGINSNNNNNNKPFRSRLHDQHPRHHYYHQQHYQQQQKQSFNTNDIQQLVRTNTKWTLLWQWMIEEHATIMQSTYASKQKPGRQNASNNMHKPSMPSLRTQLITPDKDTITSHVGSPSPPPPLPSLLFWSSSHLITGTVPDMYPESSTNRNRMPSSISSPVSYDDYPSQYPRTSPSKVSLKSKPASPSNLFSGVGLCHKSSHGILRRLSSVSSLR